MRSVSAASTVGDEFSAAPLQNSAVRNIELSIEGMTCATCAARVEKKLNAIGPEIIAAVNFATGKATVTASEAVSAQALIAAVEGAGYAAQAVSPAAPAAAAARRSPRSIPRPRTCAGGSCSRWCSSSRSATCR